jgi:hypothetical protein
MKKVCLKDYEERERTMPLKSLDPVREISAIKEKAYI